MSKNIIFSVFFLLYFVVTYAQQNTLNGNNAYRDTLKLESYNNQIQDSLQMALKITTTFSGFLFVDDEKIGILKSSELKRITLSKGAHSIRLISIANEQDSFNTKYEVTETGIEKTLPVDLSSIIEHNRAKEKYEAKIKQEEETIKNLETGDGFFKNKDYANALIFYNKAADQDNAQAEIRLGFMYKRALGVNEDESQALSWCQKAAMHSLSKAEISNMEDAANDYFTRKHYDVAFGFYQIAANAGDANAECKLGYIYAFGAGTTRNDTQSFMWYQKAADQDNMEAERKLAEMYARGNTVSIDFKMAVKWYLKAASKGDALSQYSLGNMYFYGRLGVQIDYQKAYKYVEMAYEQGFTSNQELYILGSMLSEGLGVEQDKSRGSQLLKEYEEKYPNENIEENKK